MAGEGGQHAAKDAERHSMCGQPADNDAKGNPLTRAGRTPSAIGAELGLGAEGKSGNSHRVGLAAFQQLVVRC